MAVVETIVVAYDDPTTGTLARAVDLAEALGSTLIVTNVAPTEPEDGKDTERFARERLEQARSYLDQRGLTAEFVQSVGPPGEAIVSLAHERDADLIVVGTRKKGFFERLVEGSVNQDVLRRAHCDVLVVHKQ